MKTMQCCREHALTAPYFFFLIRSMGDVDTDPEIRNIFAKYADWQALDDKGEPKQGANWLCADDFFELLALMEAWRTGGLEGARAWCERQKAGSK
jgi:hypothetical protein